MRTGTPRHPRRTLGVAAVATLLGGALGSAAVPGPASATVQPVATPIPLTSVPTDGATNIRTEVPVSVTAQAGERLADVTLAAPDGAAIPGSLNPDGTVWTADDHLRTRTHYTLTATGVASDGTQVTRSSSFTTFAPGADEQLKFQTTEPQNGDTVGVGMPILVQFTHPVTDRAAVEKALVVQTSPAQAGHWSWLSDSRLDWRPESYWQPGTKVQVSLNLDGVPAGAGKYGGADTSFGFTVGRKQVSVVDLSKHEMTVYQNGSAIRSMPVTGGMPGDDTWGGTMAVIDKNSSMTMTSQSVGFGDAYDIPNVRYAIHLTYSGTYIHAAPWSVGSQGYANVSHGCVGLSLDRAAWMFQNTIPGDLVQVENSPKTVAPGNGYGDWQENWNQWLSGSAVKS
ncbi:L,D-transpeptidase family protein [Catenulispora sp. NF23]|uniref:L,D-transpeptidase n=1 Tax=Catenulispora pinistramenti TaxID=2705254 RepID=UPI001BAD8363|nr:Ig-like domain-containing protein [Catenulispora pinistramenti]MBS2535095.1 L,D-transpeptidase family protein [Catenulispora pinistramenti]